MPNQPPEIIEVTEQQLDALLERAASNTLGEEDTELLRQIFASYAQLFQILGDKNTSIDRLRKLLFGASSEKSDKVLGDGQDAEAADASPSDVLGS